MDIRFTQRFPSVAEGRLPKSIYVVGSPDSEFFEVCVTGENPEQYKKTVDKAYIDQRISEVGGVGGVRYVSNIAERNILELLDNTMIVVADASDDPNLMSSDPSTSKDGMIYMWNKDNETFIPLMRLNASPYAEGTPHLHTNKGDLDKIGTLEIRAADGSTAETLTINGRIIPAITVKNPVW